MDVERYADRLISEAIERGDLDPQEGLGEPLGELTNDPAWWIRAFLEREKLPERHAELVESIDERLGIAITMPNLADARHLLAKVNQDIIRWNADAPGPFVVPSRSEVWLVSERARRPAQGPGAG